MKFLVSVQHPVGYDGSLEGEQMVHDIGALNEEMEAAGARFFAGGLEPIDKAKSLTKQPDGKVLVTDGPYVETTEYIGGFWILEAESLEEALEWGSKAVIACRVPIEVRQFLFRPRKQPEAV